MTVGSGTQAFTAEISETNAGSNDYDGVFTAGKTVYNVTVFTTSIVRAIFFIFEIPLEEVQPATSPVEFYGLMWSGRMTENTYSGGWFFNGETANRTPAGEFELELLF